MELSISSQALSTERGSVPCSDAFLIDANRAEALATTESANSEENTLGEETTQATLPVQKVSSPGRLDRELMPCSRVIGEGVAAAPDAAVHMSRSRASCAFAADAAVSRSALSASAISRCIWWKRPLRRSVVAFAASSARLVRVARLTRSRSRRGRPGLGMSPGAGALPRSERPTDGAPTRSLWIVCALLVFFIFSVLPTPPTQCWAMVWVIGPLN